MIFFYSAFMQIWKITESYDFITVKSPLESDSGKKKNSKNQICSHGLETYIKTYALTYQTYPHVGNDERKQWHSLSRPWWHF